MKQTIRVIFPIISVILIAFLVFPSCASAGKASYEPSASFASEMSDQTADRSRSTWGASSGEIAESNDPGLAHERMVVFTASISLTVKDVTDTRDLLTEQIRTSNGYITRESNNQITMRIPARNLDDFLDYARTLGNVENESRTGTDITDQYRDNVIRLESLKSIRARYTLLLDRANTVNEMLTIERELERINTQIELMEGRIRNAETNVAFSTVTIRYQERTKLGPVSWIFYGMYAGIRWLFVWN
jgi:hypothetical protein